DSRIFQGGHGRCRRRTFRGYGNRAEQGQAAVSCGGMKYRFKLPSASGKVFTHCRQIRKILPGGLGKSSKRILSILDCAPTRFTNCQPASAARFTRLRSKRTCELSFILKLMS